MYVCICRGVTDKQLRDAVSNGATSVREVSEITGAMTQCGKCGCEAVEIIKAALQSQQESHNTELQTAKQRFDSEQPSTHQQGNTLFFNVA